MFALSVYLITACQTDKCKIIKNEIKNKNPD